MSDYSQPKRVNDIWLGHLERSALQWLCARLPAWVTPDTLTALGFSGAFVIFIGYVLSTYSRNYLWLASLGFAINWFGDSLDGSLARYRHIERPRYGFFVDHILDSFVEVLIFLGLGLSPYVRFNIACLGLISIQLLTIYIFMSTSVNGVFRISFGRFGPTEFRVLAVLMNAAMFFIGSPQVSLPFGALGLFDLVVITIAVVLLVMYVLASVSLGIELAKQENHTIQKKK